jgi:hypothetical protein
VFCTDDHQDVRNVLYHINIMESGTFFIVLFWNDRNETCYALPWNKAQLNILI